MNSTEAASGSGFVAPPPRGWEPPGGLSRVAGGLLGALGGEAASWSLPGRVVREPPNAPVAEALTAVAHGYVDNQGRPPVGVTTALYGAPPPAWLLPVAVVRQDARQIAADTLELTTLAGVPSHLLAACVAYVELASMLLAGQDADHAVKATTGLSPSDAVPDLDRPSLCGESAIDAVSAGAWALLHPGGMAAVLPALLRNTTPGVTAAVTGLLGIRDGCGKLPPAWHRLSDGAADCFMLAPGLLRVCSPSTARASYQEGTAPDAGNAGRTAGSGTGTAGTGLGGAQPEQVEPAEPTGVDEAVRPGGEAGSTSDQRGRGDPDRPVAHDAITEELEAVEDRIPVPMHAGADTQSVQRQRRLEGAGVR